MNAADEEGVRRTLGIDSWSNLSKAKMLEFVEMLPQLDNDVAKSIVEQFPDFGKFAAAALVALNSAQKSVIEADSQSREDLHRSFEATRQALQEQLRVKDITSEQRDRLVEQLMLVLKLEAEKDRERRRFLLEVFKIVVTGVAFVCVIAVLVVTGGKVKLGALANRA